MADMIFKCPECARDLTVDDKGRGLAVACPLCGKQIQMSGNFDRGQLVIEPWLDDPMPDDDCNPPLWQL